MKTLFLECAMGASGDMLTAALLALLPYQDLFVEGLNKIGIPDVVFSKESSVKCGIVGTHVSVKVHGVEESEEMHEHHHDHEHDHDHHDRGHEHAHHHSHTSLRDIEHIVHDHLDVTDKIKNDIMNVYNLIAEAESHVHGVPVTEIHFHEVGTMDALADIAAVCLLMDEIDPDEVVASPIHVGSGYVRCAHGVLPVPAPATAYLLQDIPTYGGVIKSELCTPTGAALLRYFVNRFGERPVMRIRKIGYGMGTKDFPTANCVRAMIGETEDQTDVVSELSCNVDDMTAEEIGFAMERLFEGGAFEVYTVPVGMKKSRPGTLLRVMCDPQRKEEMILLMYRYTTTIGVRETVTRRYVLERKIKTISTPYGDVRLKESTGYGVTRRKLEYDDIAKIAREQEMSVAKVREILTKWIDKTGQAAVTGTDQ